MLGLKVFHLGLDQFQSVSKVCPSCIFSFAIPGSDQIRSDQSSVANVCNLNPDLTWWQSSPLELGFCRQHKRIDRPSLEKCRDHEDEEEGLRMKHGGVCAVTCDLACLSFGGPSLVFVVWKQKVRPSFSV